MSLLHRTLETALRDHQAGRVAEANAGYDQVLRMDATQPDALYLSGLLAHQRGDHQAAVSRLERAVTARPEVSAFHNTLGDAYRLLGRLEAAEASLQIARRLDPTSRDATTNLALVWYAQQRWLDAVPLLVASVADQPDNLMLRDLLVSALPRAAVSGSTPRLREVLLRLVSDDSVDAQQLASTALPAILDAPAFLALEDALGGASQNTEPPTSPHLLGLIAVLTRDALFLALLRRCILGEERCEAVLTATRRALVLHWYESLAQADNSLRASLPLLVALAHQSFNTEYAWFVTPSEQRAVGALRDELQRVIAAGVSTNAAPALGVDVGIAVRIDVGTSLDPDVALALLACYESLAAQPFASSIADVSRVCSHALLQPLVQQQLLEPLHEQQIAAALPTLTPIHDDVSRTVRAMYEENPYPRWIGIERPGALTPDALVQMLQPGTRTNPMDAAASILVAGCGSGRQPIQMALQFPTCSVLAIDLSRTSLAYATRKAGDLNIRNIAFAQADLLELSAVALGAPQMTFGIISCSGVLHHLASPLDGWRRLVALLASNGVMKIGLYAKYARRDVDAARAFAREGGYAATADGIRACRQAILALPPSHTARGVTRFLDFFAISGCRDLILHPQERTYTAPELAHALETLGLRFLGFQVDATVAARFRQQFPHADAWVDLACWDRYEEQHPDTFAGMYQFWCTRDGAVDSASVLR